MEVIVWTWKYELKSWTISQKTNNFGKGVNAIILPSVSSRAVWNFKFATCKGEGKLRSNLLNSA